MYRAASALAACRQSGFPDPMTSVISIPTAPRWRRWSRRATQEVQALGSVERLQQPILMQMLDGAAVVINVAHHVVMAAADKQRAPGLEIRGASVGPCENQPIDAARLLVHSSYLFAGTRQGFRVQAKTSLVLATLCIVIAVSGGSSKDRR